MKRTAPALVLLAIASLLGLVGRASPRDRRAGDRPPADTTGRPHRARPDDGQGEGLVLRRDHG